MQRFTERRVLITGAASGIGRATTLRLAEEGAEIFALDMSAEGLAETASSVGDPTRISTRVVDITDAEAVREAVAEAIGTMGHIDVLLNIAGIHMMTPLHHLDVDVMRKMFEVNVIGTALMCRETVPHMTEGGAIVSMSSLSVHEGNPYMGGYAASKGAVLAFSRTLAAELLSHRIRVNTVSPGGVTTPMTRAVAAEFATTDIDLTYYVQPKLHFGSAEPEQVASVIAFLASDDASHITGSDVRVDGGSHIS
ncbi:MAG: SDR family oxidoreductase [Propionibacterium sp.]|nr:SDR family oxidoreductase [Propionibacterium sp.]